MSSLDTRIAEAFAANHPSGVLAALLDEVAAAENRARDVSAAATERALDPATLPAEVAAARKEHEDAQFSLQRMANATPRLRQLLAETQERERAAASAEARKAALAERDALARELAEFYPPMAEKLADLLRRIASNNTRLGLGQGAEDISRGAPPYWRVNPSPDMPTLVEGVRLPAFKLSQHGPGYVYDGWKR